MKTNNRKEKSIDAVKMMREIRDKISKETEKMTFIQLNVCIEEKLSKSNSKLIGLQ